MYKYFSNKKGQLVTNLLAVLAVVMVGGVAYLYYLYEEGSFRFEFGSKKQVKVPEEVVFDKNRVMELIRKEKFLTQEEQKVTREKQLMEELQKQINLEKRKLRRDRDFLTDKMNEITTSIQEMSQEEQENLQSLANMYSKMKASRVAIIFKELDKETVAELLSRMSDKISAKILGEIGIDNAKRAAEITDIMQGRAPQDFLNQVA